MTYADARRRLLLEYIVASVTVSYFSFLAKVTVLRNMDLHVYSAAQQLTFLRCTTQTNNVAHGLLSDCDAFQHCGDAAYCEKTP